MSAPDIRTNEYYEELRKKFSLNPNDDRSKLFKLYYGKIYENLPSHHNPIQINNILFTKRYKEIYNMSYINQSETEQFISNSNSYISEEFIKSNFPLYFLSKDFVENAMDADIDKNILFEDISLPFSSVYYTLPNNMFLDWFSLTYIPEKDDILLYASQSQQNSQNILFLRNFLTSPEVNEKDTNQYNPIISFAIATLLFHKTGGFNQKIIPITPLPITKNRMGKIVIGERKKVSPNILNSPKISYRKKSDFENPNEPVEFEGYKQIPSHIRIIKDKKTGEIKIISVSSSEVNPDKRREGVEFQKNKMTDNEIAQLIKARREDIVSRMKSRGFSEDEINQFLKQKNLNESFFKKEMNFKEYFFLREETIKSVKYDSNDFDSNAFENLTPLEIDQLGTKNFVSKENWPSLRKFLVKRSIASNPLTDPELIAYTPGETLNLLNNPIIKKYHSEVINYKVPESYDTIIFIPCAKTKPWEGACRGNYKSYNKIRNENKNVYSVTISEPLGIVPQDLWGSFPQYDNPGLFKDPVQRSGLMTKDWIKIFGVSSRLQTPFDYSAYKECIKILGNIIKGFISNNPDFKYLSFVEDFKGKGTHSEMLDVAGFIDSSIRLLKRENPKEEPYSYIKKFL